MFSTPDEAIVLPPCENNFFTEIFCHSFFPLDFFRKDFAPFSPYIFSAKISPLFFRNIFCKDFAPFFPEHFFCGDFAPLFFRNIFFAEIFRTDKKEGIFVRGGWTLWSCPPSENAL